MKCPINGVIVKKLKKHQDARGWLMELFRNDELPKSINPAMAYISFTRPGVTRGPHEHKKQSDLFCFLGTSKFKLYLWDNRKKSSTFGKKSSLTLKQAESILIIVPPGVVHAYKNIGKKDGLVFNAPNRLFKGHKRSHHTDEIRHEDDPKSPFKLND
jgi:dTDP-4-dehydrorhamnose 3,5-epimerase